MKVLHQQKMKARHVQNFYKLIYSSMWYSTSVFCDPIAVWTLTIHIKPLIIQDSTEQKVA